MKRQNGAARFEGLSKEFSDEALRLARLVLVLRCRSLRLPVLAHLTATAAILLLLLFTSRLVRARLRQPCA